jgi:hypothetical protein
MGLVIHTTVQVTDANATCAMIVTEIQHGCKLA